MANTSVRIANLSSCTSPQSADSLVIESAGNANVQQVTIQNFEVTTIGANTFANLPAANSVSVGKQLYVTDENTMATSDGNVWTLNRQKRTGDLTLYVRTDGNDSNDGLTNDASGAKATLQGAFDVIRSYDGNGYICQVFVANGTYPSGSNRGEYFDGWEYVEILGNIADASTVVLQAVDAWPNNTCLNFEYCRSPIYVSGFKLIGNPANFSNGFWAYKCSVVNVCDYNYTGDMIIENQRIGFYFNDTNCDFFSDIEIISPITHGSFWATDGSYVGVYGDTLAITGDIATNTGAYYAFWLSLGTGSVLEEGVTNFSTTGTATGRPYHLGDKAYFYHDVALTNFGNLTPTNSNLSIYNNLAYFIKGTTKANLPTSFIGQGAVAFCTDESGGSTLVFYDGTNWRRVSDRAIVT